MLRKIQNSRSSSFINFSSLFLTLLCTKIPLFSVHSLLLFSSSVEYLPFARTIPCMPILFSYYMLPLYCLDLSDFYSIYLSTYYHPLPESLPPHPNPPLSVAYTLSPSMSSVCRKRSLPLDKRLTGLRLPHSLLFVASGSVNSTVDDRKWFQDQPQSFCLRYTVRGRDGLPEILRSTARGIS